MTYAEAVKNVIYSYAASENIVKLHTFVSLQLSYI